jgi:hypothetical protein
MGPTRVGGRTTRQTRHRFELRRRTVPGGAERLRRIGITLSRAPQPGRCIAQPTLSNSHLARRPNGEARGLLVVPRWFLTKFPIYGTAPQLKLSRVKPLGYAARQLTIELPTSSDKEGWTRLFEQLFRVDKWHLPSSPIGLSLCHIIMHPPLTFSKFDFRSENGLPSKLQARWQSPATGTFRMSQKPRSVLPDLASRFKCQPKNLCFNQKKAPARREIFCQLASSKRLFHDHKNPCNDYLNVAPLKNCDRCHAFSLSLITA